MEPTVAAATAAYYEDIVAQLGSILSAALRGGDAGLSGNTDLVYTILHRSGDLAGLEGVKNLESIVAPVYVLVQWLSRALGLDYNAAALAGGPDSGQGSVSPSRRPPTSAEKLQGAVQQLLQSWSGKQQWPSVIVDCVVHGPFSRETRRRFEAASSSFETFMYRETSEPAAVFGPMVVRASVCACPDVFPAMP